MPTELTRPISSQALLTRLLDTPRLVETVRAMPPAAFSAVVREIGVADAGELVALATTEQLVSALDEDLFVNDAPGEHERFDRSRFVLWLEVLLEGDEAAVADRFVELSEDFVVHALTSLVLVLDDDALRERMDSGGDDAELADKALESSLAEEIDGYLLVALEPNGWDAVVSLVLALDRHHRQFLTRVLDRCAALASPYLDELDELANRLSALESLAEDVEAEREERRAARGYVEPRAARAFLALARGTRSSSAKSLERDPITRAYFRELERRPSGAPSPRANAPALPILEVLRELERGAPDLFAERMDELAYLTNVLLAGAGRAGSRFGLGDAVHAVLATVTFGALLEARTPIPAVETLARILSDCSADRLFRLASGSLGGEGLLRSAGELEAATRRLDPAALVAPVCRAEP